mmetsp:Transcript_8631/g.11633  ORF Transcript_8631/g.11633 Transcript_8631/m.11633 type:complete len:363 (+) Transcript_8631:85-1173(+)|eukprot:CAMPEP_0201481300 /NCGR_PEP_ID=MMETSP0151_2-20130828/5571_1 /ASSEMBLY_ACC=CAM_ASM_000257 /TAXON_ID=200890 /ORGANISM="Paramoeba atlantica, Strain 621/1 / CCAP 1560/9" /LENGTH=362 /DNA_ID=CAMNT_0047863417 /DNA_START=70 /DNA_END=1158 /DNA_ORIENTATION=+
MDGLVLDYALFISRVEANKKKQGQEVHKKRLAERLDLFGFKQEDVTGDGNCQFHAVARQISHNWPDQKVSASKLREMAVTWLRKNAEWNPWKEDGGSELHHFVDEEWGTYCTRMAKSGQWGDHVTLIALVETLNVGIRIISSVEGDQFMTEIDPSSKSGHNSLGRKRVFFLGHWSEFHYVSLIEEADMAMTISNFDRSNIQKLEVAHSSHMLFNAAPRLPPKSSSPPPKSEPKNPQPKQEPQPSSSSSSSSGSSRRVLKVKSSRTGETRRVAFDDWPENLNSVHQTLKNIFASNMPPLPYFIQYRDDGGAMIPVTSMDGLKKCFSSADAKKNRVAFLEIGECVGDKQSLLSKAKELEASILN